MQYNPKKNTELVNQLHNEVKRSKKRQKTAER